MFSRWGDFSYRHRILVSTTMVTLIGALYALFGTNLDQHLSQEGWDDPRSPSSVAATIEQDTFGRDNSGDIIIFFEATGGGDVTAQPNAAAASQTISGLAEIYPDNIEAVTSYFDKRNANLINENKTLAFATISLKGDGEQTLKDFRTIQPELEKITQSFEGVTISIAGATAIADALDTSMANDIKRAELIALPVVAILLLVVFGSLTAAAMPLIVGLLSIVGSLGVLALLAQFTQVNVFSQSVVTLLGLGLAIDYGLFMVSRFREELKAGREVPKAVRITTATAGKTVVFSAALVAVALSGLLLFPQAFLKSIAYGAISAVGLAAILSVTILPALFAWLGDRIDLLAFPWARRAHTDITTSWWYRLPQRVMRRPIMITVVFVAALITLTIPLGGIKFGGINETYLPPTNETRVAQQLFDGNFPQYRTEPIKLVVTNATNEQLVEVFTQANQVQGLTGRFTPTSETKDGTTVLAAGIQDRSLNEYVVDQLRAITIPQGVQVYIGGTPALERESLEALLEKLPLMAAYIIAATFLLMALIFGSAILPVKAIIMNILGLGTTLGLLTLIFVDGFGASLLGITPGPLMSPVLVLIIAIVYGLSTDYEVFLLSRMVEGREAGATTDQAIKYGTAHTGGIITAAALIMIVVCGAFGFSEIVIMKYIAIGMIFALLIDATVIRMLLVPAVMHMLRDDNWWAPGWVKKASRILGHHGSETLTPYGNKNSPWGSESGKVADQPGEPIPFAQLAQRLEREKNT